MGKGIIWVGSRVVDKEQCSPEKFCDWYENIHIQQVTSLSGIPSAVRYEAIAPQPDAQAWSNEAPYLTVYEMKDTSFRETAEFKGLDGQSKPSEELLEGIFKQARFDTRFYNEVQFYEKPGAKKGPASLILSAALQPPPEGTQDFDAWYREEHIPMLAQAPGYVRTRRFDLVSGTALERFERRVPEIPRFLALHEFEGEDFPWKELGESTQTEWSKRILKDLVSQEAGWFRLKRDYPESEWGSVGV